jgi:hypothetical protein
MQNIKKDTRIEEINNYPYKFYVKAQSNARSKNV